MQDVESYTPVSIDSATIKTPSATLEPNENSGSSDETKPLNSPRVGDALPDIVAPDGESDMDIGQGKRRAIHQHLICSGSKG